MEIRVRASAPLRGVLAFSLFVGLFAPGAAFAEKIQFDIASGDARSQLKEFSKQSNLAVLFDWDDMTGIAVGAVHGDLDPLDALDRMIAGTVIGYKFVNRRTVVLSVTAPAAMDRSKAARKESRDAGDRRSLGAQLPEVTVSSEQWKDMLAGQGASVLSLSREDIDAAGFATVQDVIRTLPQVFGGGPTQDTVQGTETRTNVARGTGLNLRGLGAGSTLVLMNGRRLPGGGSEGLFVDISNLPLAAIERIDILPDSSSTFYGSDAVGGVVNFVMRDRFEGRQTEGYFGTATRGGDLRETYFSQLLGSNTRYGHGMLAMDFYSRDNLRAAERSQARSDLTLFGGSNFDLVQSNPGNIVLGTTTWAVPHGQDGTSLQAGDFTRDSPNFQNQYKGADILPAQQRFSVFGTWRQDLGDRASFFSDLLIGQRNVRTAGPGVPASFVVPGSNAFYVSPLPLPFRLPLLMRYNFYDDLGPQIITGRVQDAAATIGLDFRMGDRWTVVGTLGYAVERIRSDTQNQVNVEQLNNALASPDPRVAFNPFGDGSHTSPATLDAIRGSTFTTYRSSLTSAVIAVHGSLATLAGGDLGLSFGSDARQQTFRGDLSSDAGLAPMMTSTHRRRVIRSAFLELQVPLVGPPNGIPGLQSLAVSLAERYEHHSDFGPAIAPRLGLSWTPFRGLSVRSTYSRSYRPPGLLDFDESSNAYVYTSLINPGTNRLAIVLLWGGKNRDLKEEKARSWTVGLELEPELLPDTALALTYFNTDFSNRLNTPTFSTDLLSNQALSPLLIRDPSPELRAEVCSRAPLSSSGASSCTALPVAAIADLRLRNDAHATTSGVDLIGRYLARNSLGTFSFSLNGTYIFDFAEARTETVPLVDRVSTQSYPIDLKLRGSVGWQRGRFDISAHANFINAYRDIASTPRRSVNSWTTLDLYSAYTLGDTTVALSVENLMDRDPPFLNNLVGIGYDQENADLTGRVVAVQIRKKW